MAETSDFPDLLTLLANAGSVAPAITMMLQGIIALIGLYLVASGLVELWGVSHDNALKYVAGRQRFSTGSALVSIGIGAVMLSLSTLEWMGIMSRTIMDGSADATARIMPSDMSYDTSGGSSSYDVKGRVAAMALLAIMQVVGLVAMVKALMTVNRYYNNEQAHLGSAAGWALGGVLCWNFRWFVEVVNNTLGFKIISMFSFAPGP